MLLKRCQIPNFTTCRFFIDIPRNCPCSLKTFKVLFLPADMSPKKNYCRCQNYLITTIQHALPQTSHSPSSWKSTKFLNSWYNSDIFDCFIYIRKNLQKLVKIYVFMYICNLLTWLSGRMLVSWLHGHDFNHRPDQYKDLKPCNRNLPAYYSALRGVNESKW